MPQVNFASHELICKIVYCGPESAGKTTNLAALQRRLPAPIPGRLTRLDSGEGASWEFLPASLGTIGLYRVYLHLYSAHNPTPAFQRILLKDVDGLVFVADSERGRLQENAQCLEALEAGLRSMGRDPPAIPIVLQYNKRDLPGALPIAQLREAINPEGRAEQPATARIGAGVVETQRTIARAVLSHLHGLMQGEAAPNPGGSP